MPENEKFIFLLNAYLEGNCTEEQKQELARWVDISDDNTLSSVLETVWFQHPENRSTLSQADSDEILRKILLKDRQTPTIKIRSKRFYILRIAAASVIFFAISLGAYLHYYTSKQNKLNTNHPLIAQTSDVAPGVGGATLTLADGRTIVLDSMKGNNELLGVQGSSKLQLKDKQLVYNSTNGAGAGLESSPVYNTLTTPNGHTFQLVLPDGTKVWLNAASSIKYPVSFNDKKREVTISGEAYFEVVKLHPVNGVGTVPFIVNVESGQPLVHNERVEVLGTHFNIKAYAGSNCIRTTLLEGAVNVYNGDQLEPVRMSPGMQATIKKSSDNTELSRVNVEDAIAWKNGLFNFDQADLSSVMMELSRWYNVEVIYQGKIPQRIFWGKMQRSLYLSEVLRALEKVNIHFKIEGNKLLVMP